MTDKPLDRYAVMGNPVAHSKSPQIHQQFAEQTAQLLSYEKIQVEPGQLAEAVNAFINDNGKGLNITVPLKEEAFNLATNLTARAKRAGAVNTLILHDANHFTGDNTDGVGLVRDLTVNHQISLTSKNVLILGAGGAVRGILEPFINEKPAHIVIANRTVSRAQQLADDFFDIASIVACGFNELDQQQFDIVINGTSASLSGELPPLPNDIFSAQAAAYDMMYGKDDTPFMAWARKNNANAVMDGLGMLVEQAAESFYCWRKLRPETAPVIEAIRKAL